MVALNFAEEKPKVEQVKEKVEEEQIEVPPVYKSDFELPKSRSRNGLQIVATTITVQVATLIIFASFFKQYNFPIGHTLKMSIIVTWWCSSQLVASFITRKVIISYWSTGNHFPVGLMKLLMILYMVSSYFALCTILFFAYYKNLLLNSDLRPQLLAFSILIPLHLILAIGWWRIEEKMIAKENHREISLFSPKGLGGFLKKFYE
ncbi:unnamed protein product, partial [Mesorhabditis belari]|uniref:Uncharacterized protein n=1 Tax=Mesorhabditis belari TaxID=2138241 RepID=A0AAF3F0Q7_9BILA